jgi:hypothetical protein
MKLSRAPRIDADRVKDLATAALLVAFFTVGHAVTAGAADTPTPIPSLSFSSSGWSATASPNLASHPPSTKDLANFLNTLLESAGQSFPDIGESETDKRHSGFICSFAFKDLRHDGLLSLIAGVGVPGRPSCRDVYIIDKTSQGFEIYLAGGDIGAGEDVSGGIEDVGKDGRLEFISDETLAEYDTRCNVTFPSIYAWTGHDYANVSEHFKDFYRQQIDPLNKQISAIKPFLYKGAWYFPGEKECLQADVALLERFVGISANAGLEHTMQLAKSKYSIESDFAAQLLRLFNAPEFSKGSNGKASDTFYRLAVVKPASMR